MDLVSFIDMKNIYFYLALGFLILFTSCLKDIDEISKIKGVTVTPTMALPLINAEANLGDLVKKGNNDKAQIEADSNSLLYVLFNKKDSLPEKQYFTFPVFGINMDIPMLPTAITDFVNTGFYTASIDTVISLGINTGERIERVLVKEGSISFTVGSNFQHDVTFKVEYPGITKNGIPLTDSFTFIYSGTPPANITRTLNIKGYEIDYTNNGFTNNVFPFKAKMDISRKAPNGVNLTDKVSFSQNLSINSYSRMEGYFGKFIISAIKQINVLSIFDKKVDGSVSIFDPRLEINVVNSFGLPITAKISSIYAETSTGSILPVTINFLKDTFSLEYTSSIGQTRTTKYIIDKTNSNIDQIINSAPKKFIYEVTFYANYHEIIQANVLYDYTSVKQDASLVLPFDIKVLDYAIETDGEFDFTSSIADMDSSEFTVNWAEVESKITNEMPMAANIQIYLEDSVSNMVLDSLFYPDYILPGANVDVNGEPVQPVIALINNKIGEARISNFRKANKYRMVVKLNSGKFNNVISFGKFYDFQKIRARIGVRVNATYSSDN